MSPVPWTAGLLLAWAGAIAPARALQGVAGGKAPPPTPAPVAAEPLDLVSLLTSRNVEVEGAERTAARIVGLGSPALSEILLSLADGRVRSGERVLPLTHVQRAALEAATSRFGRASISTWCQEQLAGEEDPALRRAALIGLARVGTGQDLTLALALAKLADPDTPEAQRVADALGQAAEAFLRRDERALEVVRDRAVDLEEMRARPLIAALGGMRQSRASHALFDLLQRTPPELKPLVLSHAANAAPWAHHPVDARVLQHARAGLRSLDEGLVRASMAAVGAMQDFESAEALIEMMEGDAPGRARMAEVALREMTGMNLGPVAKPWKQWLERESRWYAERFPRIVGDLEANASTAAQQALREIGTYRYQRQELGLALGAVLRRREPHLRASACRVLKGLGSVAPRRELLECLEDPNLEVSAAALECLQAVTGFKEPADVEAWERLLGESR